MSASGRRMQRVVERIADDRRFATRFREDPQRAVRRYRLDEQQLAALKAGDAASLAAQGVDVARFAAGRRRGIRSRLVRVTAVAVLALSSLGLTAGPASAARYGSARLGRRLDGIWSLGHARDASGNEEIGSQLEELEVPTAGAPGQGKPFEVHK